MGKEPAGNIDLSDLSSQTLAHADGNFETAKWERMLRRLQARQMPPIDANRPNKAEYADTIEAISNSLDQFATKYPRPGKTDTIRRLTRTEYSNAVRDLLGIDFDVSEILPSEESSHGFDNVTVGELSPLLLNRYITAAQKISRLAVGASGRGPSGVTLRLPADQTQDSHIEGLPLGTRGGGILKHTFAESGEYEIQLRLSRDRDEKVEGLNEDYQIDVLLDRARVHRFELPRPKNGDFTNVDAALKARFNIAAGAHDIGVTFPRKDDSLLEIRRQPFDAAYNRHRHPRQGPAIFEISIVGPFGVESSKSNFTASGLLSSGENETNTLKRLMRLAYRRPIIDEDLKSPLKFLKSKGLESALASILVNPNFLFRIEREPTALPTGASQAITDLDLASRLSFFLWSSIPDNRLLTLAENHQLQDADVLRGEVTRMLADPRSASLVKNFANQWLYLQNLDSIHPDLRLFPDFDDNLRQSFRQETELLFECIQRDDRSVLDLLTADFAFLNERLAVHYDLPNVVGSHFRRVDLPADSHRGGLLRQGSILTVTSYATRTAPTIRGNWILKNVIGTPPPPPPPNVPSLKEESTSDAVSVRERLAEHRENPSCASCHNLMDPIGFALDNYDAVGRWRTFEGELPIDVSGTLPDGSEVDGVADLEQGILQYPELFVQTLSEKLLVFALGRGIELDDGPEVRRIVKAAAKDAYKFSALIQNVVASKPFRMRTVQ